MSETLPVQGQTTHPPGNGELERPDGPATVAFERQHSIDIQALPEAVFDYVTNPQSWPKWIAVSHQVDSADRPLRAGETFSEKWFSREEILLEWRVLRADRPHRWEARTFAGFIGPIVVQYDFERIEIEGRPATRYTRTVRNPARSKPPTPAMIERIDAEAVTALGNIRKQVEALCRAPGG